MLYIFAKRSEIFWTFDFKKCSFIFKTKIYFLNYVEYGAVCLSPLLSAHQCSGLRSTAPLLQCIGIVRLLLHFYVGNGLTVLMVYMRYGSTAPRWGMVQPGRVCSLEWPLFYVRNGSTMWGMVQLLQHGASVCSPEWPLYGQSRSCHSWPEPNPGHSKMNTLVLSQPARLSFLQVMAQKGSKIAHVTHRAQYRPLKN